MMNSPSFSLLDQQFARFLTRLSGLTGERARTIFGLAARLSAALAAGDSCLVLTEDEETVARSGKGLVSEQEDTPLVIWRGRLYLQRYFRYESRLARQIKALARATNGPFPAANGDGNPSSAALAGTEAGLSLLASPDFQELLSSCFGAEPDSSSFTNESGIFSSVNDISGRNEMEKGTGHFLTAPNRQRQAAEMALTHPLALISGGPGTGKSFTVARILGLLLQALGPDLKIALAAPTGKAAMRLRESIAAGLESFPLAESLKAKIPTTASTLHRLLGARRHSPHFRHHHDNPLPWDIVLVDEASMVDLALMSKLVDALPATARLILLGDKDQLVSVESGAVLADCIAALPDNTVVLRKSYRFNPEIDRFAQAVNAGDADAAWRLQRTEARSQKPEDSVFGAEQNGGGGVFNVPVEQALELCVDRYARYMEQVRMVWVEGWRGEEGEEMGRLFAALHRFRVLCATRQGAGGVETINRQVEQKLAARGYSCQPGGWYPGRPVMILRNDYDLNLFNGDIGICLPDRAPGEDGGDTVWFRGEDGGFHGYQASRLPEHETVFAMTIHKSQGSEFDEALALLPPDDSPLLTRELIYTAVTRARTRVLLAGTEAIFRRAVSRAINRASGLRAMLTDTG